MHLNWILIISVFFAIKCSELESLDICNKKQNETCPKGIYDCGNFHCATTKQTCDSFKHYSLASRKIKNSIRDQIRLIKYQEFINKLKKCELLKYVFKLEDVCLNNKICLLRKRIPMRTGESYIYKKNLCQCEGVFGFTCSGKYCTTSYEACLHFTQRLDKNSNLIAKINKCYV